MDSVTKEFWDKEIVRGNLIWPDEQVIRFVKRNYKPNSGIKILDFGCGAGRNTVALIQEGYHVIAMDYNESGLMLLKKKMRNLKENMVEYRLNNGLEIPIDNESVDGIVADGSLFYYNRIDTINLLKNLRVCLKKNGLMWADWRNKQDSLYGQGVEVEKGLFRLGEGSGREQCCYFFIERQELYALYEAAGFSIKSIDEYTYTTNNGDKRCAYYHVVAQK